jgi:F0F1-type ATP synthase assembly protein I
MAEEGKDPRSRSQLREPRDREPWMRIGGVGLELAAAVGGFALIGHLVDRHYGSQPKGLLIGALLGLIGGFYNLIKASLRASREARELDQERRRDHDEP